MEYDRKRKTMKLCLNYLILLLLVLVLKAQYNEARRKGGMVKLHFRELICRRCWKRLYRPCQYSMGLSKRSLPDAENFAKINQSELKTQVSLRRKRRGIRRMQRFRIRINCRNCRKNCFN